MRGGVHLDNALQYCMKNNIKLFGINKNPLAVWTDTPKVYADLYIDDRNVGCPLKTDKSLSHNPFVDWDKVDLILTDMGVYNGTFHKHPIVD